MIATPHSRSPGSIPNNRRDTFAPPVPILRRATPPNRRVLSSGKKPGGLPHPLTARIVPICSSLFALSVLRGDLPRPRNSRALSNTAHPHETRVNRTSCAQNDPPFTTLTPLPSPRKSTFLWETPECPNPSLPVLPPLGVLSVLGDLCVKLSVPLPALPILPPPDPRAYPHETRVNRTSCAQNDPSFAIVALPGSLHFQRQTLPVWRGTQSHPQVLVRRLAQKNRGGVAPATSPPGPAPNNAPPCGGGSCGNRDSREPARRKS